MTIDDVNAVRKALITEVTRLKKSAQSKQNQLKSTPEDRRSKETQRRIEALDLKIKYYTWMQLDLQVMNEEKILKEATNHAIAV